MARERWLVYDRRADWPGEHYVARRFEILADTGPAPTDDIIVSADLELIRQSLELRGLARQAPNGNDEPHIVEAWL